VIVALACCALALVGSYILATWSGVWMPPGPALVGLIVAYPLWGWRRLAAINGYLLRKADGLATAEGPVPVDHSGGFDSIARSVNRLDFLVDELAERRAFLRRVIEATPDALCVFDRNGSLMMMNQRARALVGKSQADTEGLDVSALLTAVHGSLSVDGKELRLEDGRIFVVTRSTGDADAHWPEIHLAMFTDVTAQRLAEAERRQALEFLSHDMRAPQVAILGLAKDRSDDLADAERLERIRAHARRTMELADNFVELARLAERPLDLDEHELVALCEEAADRAFSVARDHGAKVRVEGPDDPVFVTIDGQVMARVFDNLIGNAIKYGASLVTVSLGQTAKATVVSLSDNGPGMPEERRADPFARFGARSRAKTKGAGLGLAFVKAAVEHHGGRIDCESETGRGTTFRITLPPVSPA
jgi:PAS domain S-box-containing protein